MCCIEESSHLVDSVNVYVFCLYTRQQVNKEKDEATRRVIQLYPLSGTNLLQTS